MIWKMSAETVSTTNTIIQQRNLLVIAKNQRTTDLKLIMRIPAMILKRNEFLKSKSRVLDQKICVLILKIQKSRTNHFLTFLNPGNENQKIGKRMFGKNRSKKRTLFEVKNSAKK